MIGCEPYIAGNVGSGTVEEMAKWVADEQLDAKSTMTDLRNRMAGNEPCGVKFWGVGNEKAGVSGGNMTADFYADQYKRYASIRKKLAKKHH